MNLSQLKQNNTILSRYGFQYVNDNHTAVDTNLNVRVDLGPELDGKRLVKEPILDVGLEALNDFAELNDLGSILTKDDIGEINQLEGKLTPTDAIGGSELVDKKNKGTLSDLARELNPFKGKFHDEDVSWAIESTERTKGILYIIAKK